MWQSGGVEERSAERAQRTGDLLAELRAVLAAGGIEDPDAEAQLLLGHALGASRGRVQAMSVLGAPVDPERVDAVRELAEERARRVPLQHLTGRAPFRSIELSVGPGVFVPRPETETVAQFAIDALQAVPDPEPVAVDLCTGSGAIALAIAAEVPTARVWAVEKSREAHAWAERNVREWGAGRVELLLGDARDPQLPERIVGRVDVLVSNPPYVPRDMVPRDPEVRDHDPELALYSGADGLELIRAISLVGLGLVRPGGTLVLEHAEMQGESIRRLLAADGWRAAATHRDLTGRDRATTALR
ncbi:peptide chain release factor N(5)-glutamine methyltransferase [Leucobacter triazinivorans]|uniref:Release factor glutamine methyltransferase n=1 Tax=Leucobacter triazinivorans TaxID=1784719 RepID=A0A4P6KJ68_9MICO|nr:peptide chain release factor N(5)-glutamine methyltransferase [Leucobacter triazinivorans]